MTGLELFGMIVVAGSILTGFAYWANGPKENFYHDE